MHKLPAMMAQRIAMRLKGGGAAEWPEAAAGAAPPGACARHGGARERAPGGGGPRPGGPPDFQQMLNRMPAVTLADLQKGDALMIVATEGSAEVPSTVIILLAASSRFSPRRPARQAPSSRPGTSPPEEILERGTLRRRKYTQERLELVARTYTRRQKCRADTDKSFGNTYPL